LLSIGFVAVLVNLSARPRFSDPEKTGSTVTDLGSFGPDTTDREQKAMELQDHGGRPSNPVNATVNRRTPKSRKHLLPAEVARLMARASKNRHGHRDAAAVMLAFRHGLRASEFVGLRWTTSI
jgi:integrase